MGGSTFTHAARRSLTRSIRSSRIAWTLRISCCSIAASSGAARGVGLAMKSTAPSSSALNTLSSPLRELITTVGRVAGKKPPSRAVPTGMLKLMAPAGPLVGKLMGQPPNLRELISSADGVTFWARHDKAIADLGYSPRGLEQGMRDTLAEGSTPRSAYDRVRRPVSDRISRPGPGTRSGR